MITRQHVMPYIGQRVVVRTNDGAIHHGILHSCDGNGIYLRSIGNGVRMVNTDRAEQSVSLLHELPQNTEITEAWWPFFFLPWLAIAAFWPWAWWW